MKHFGGKVAAITGAGSGLGRALALELAGRGAHVALSDVGQDGLAATAAMCRDREVEVSSVLVDVADRAAVFGWAEEVVEQHGRVNLIVNNAGVSLVGTVSGLDVADFEWLTAINFWGVVHGTKAFLPHLEASGEGHVVNISSVFGLLGVPGQSAYCAAKFAVRGFTEALRMELDLTGSCVSATTVHPGGIKTNIARSARLHPSAADLPGAQANATGELDAESFGAEFEQAAATTPADAARQILQAVERNRRRAVVGPDAKVLDLLSRLPAGLSHRAIALRARRRR